MIKVEINGITYHYATVKKTVGSGLAGNGCVVQATISPDNATNKRVTMSSFMNMIFLLQR